MFNVRKLLLTGAAIFSSVFSDQAISSTTNSSLCKILEHDLMTSSLQGIGFIKQSNIQFNGKSGRNWKLTFLSNHHEDSKAKFLGSNTLFSGAQSQGVVVEVESGHISDRCIVKIYFKNKHQQKDRLAISNEYNVQETNKVLKIPSKLNDTTVHFKK